jgi:putative ABC transport system permease protein
MNYINLTTAKALQRVKEVGIRETLGSNRAQLASQFVGESFLFFTFATILAVLLALGVWPVFSNMLQISLPVSNLFNFQNLLVFLLTAMIAGLLSGLYPAFFLTRVHPAGILKDRNGGLKINFSLRKALIVFQFSMSMVMIIATIVVWKQLDLFNNRPLGFNKDHLLVLPPINSGTGMNAFKNILLENPNITSASFTGVDFENGIGNSSSMTDPSDEKQKLEFGFVYADFDFIKTLGIELKEGRNFSDEFPADRANYDSLSSEVQKKSGDEAAENLRVQNPIIVTESLAKSLNLSHPVNEVLRLSGLQGRIIGVVKDFQITTLKQISPLLVYKPQLSWYRTKAFIKLNNRNIPESISYIEDAWKKSFPSMPFSYAFADDSLQTFYASENRLASIFTLFAFLAIGISSLGLLSLVSLIVKQRSKEIGIRKVLGASVPGITLLLSRDFLTLIIVSALIASPIAWYGMNIWLKDFAHRISIEWWMFLLAGCSALVTGILTVSVQTIRAAKTNPVDILKRD